MNIQRGSKGIHSFFTVALSIAGIIFSLPNFANANCDEASNVHKLASLQRFYEKNRLLIEEGKIESESYITADSDLWFYSKNKTVNGAVPYAVGFRMPAEMRSALEYEKRSLQELSEKLDSLNGDCEGRSAVLNTYFENWEARRNQLPFFWIDERGEAHQGAWSVVEKKNSFFLLEKLGNARTRTLMLLNKSSADYQQEAAAVDEFFQQMAAVAFFDSSEEIASLRSGSLQFSYDAPMSSFTTKGLMKRYKKEMEEAHGQKDVILRIQQKALLVEMYTEGGMLRGTSFGQLAEDVFYLMAGGTAVVSGIVGGIIWAVTEPSGNAAFQVLVPPAVPAALLITKFYWRDWVNLLQKRVLARWQGSTFARGATVATAVCQLALQSAKK